MDPPSLSASRGGTPELGERENDRRGFIRSEVLQLDASRAESATMSDQPVQWLWRQLEEEREEKRRILDELHRERLESMRCKEQLAKASAERDMAMRICGLISRGRSASPTDRPASPMMSPSRSTFSSLPKAYTSSSSSVDRRHSPAWTKEMQQGERDAHYSGQSPLYSYKPSSLKSQYSSHLPRVNEGDGVMMGDGDRTHALVNRLNLSEERNTRREYHSRVPSRLTSASAYVADRGTRMESWGKGTGGYHQSMEASSLVRCFSTSVYDQVSNGELTRSGLTPQHLAQKFSPCFSPGSVSGDSIDMMSSAGVTTDVGSWVNGNEEEDAGDKDTEKDSNGSTELVPPEPPTRRLSTSSKVVEQPSLRPSALKEGKGEASGKGLQKGPASKEPASAFESLNRVVIAELSVYKNLPPGDIVKLWSAVLTLIGFRDASYDSNMKTKSVWREIQKQLITASTNQQHRISSIYRCLKEAETKIKVQPLDAATLKVFNATIPTAERVKTCSKPAEALHAWAISAVELSTRVKGLSGA